MAGNIDRLKAGAAGGTAGMQAYDKAISDVGSQQQQALSDAAARSGALNAPQAFADKQAAFVGQPGATAITQLNANKGALGNYQGAINSAQDNYMGGLQASRDLLSKLGIKDAGDSQWKALQAAQGALSSAVNFQKLLNPDSAQTPAEQRSQTQYEWAQQAHDEKLKTEQETKYNDFARAGITKELLGSSSKADKTALAATGYESLDGAISALAEDSNYAKLKPQEQQQVLSTLQYYYNPVSDTASYDAWLNPTAGAPAAAPAAAPATTATTAAPKVPTAPHVNSRSRR